MIWFMYSKFNLITISYCCSMCFSIFFIKSLALWRNQNKTAVFFNIIFIDYKLYPLSCGFILCNTIYVFVFFLLCRAKSRSGSGDMNRIVTLFIQLVTQLEQGAKSSYYEREEMMRVWRDESPAVSKYKKKHGKAILDRKYMNRNSCVSSNGVFDHGEYASDRELRKRLSKLNRRSLDSGTETSDDIDRSSEDGKSDSESTVSDTDTDLDFRSRADGYFTPDEGDCMPDEREWGARMTKAGLVPPVTRKYEVIDQYVIVADEEDVKRKMRVSLPEDYAEKLNAQKNGSEELDMELPEVKEYQPRKKLGDQVIEQEVYGIDPYTHNLLLDSMPEELDWTLLEKHLFIEDVLLRTLNQQVRHFTGTGNTPMMYSLQPVIEEIRRAAEEDCDVRVIKVCHGILKAIDNRPDDKYVAYRKVFCYIYLLPEINILFINFT